MPGNIAMAAAALFVSLAAGEAILRAFVSLPLQRVEPEVRYDRHAVRRFTLRPNQTAHSYGAPATIDSRGFRRNGADATATDGGTVILALGDSFTFGIGVTDEATWPARLEVELRQRVKRPVTVVNGGTISYGVFQEMDLLRESGLSTRPQVVIHGLYWNDFMSAAPPPQSAPSVVTADGYLAWDRPLDTRSGVRRAASWLFSRSALLFALRQAINQAAAPNRPVTEPGRAVMEPNMYGQAHRRFVDSGLTEHEWTVFEAFYRDLQALSTQHGFVPYVVIMPVSDVVARPGASEHPYAVQARRRLTALGVKFLDGLTLWERRGLDDSHFLPQGADAHLDETGYRILAEQLASDLLAQGVLPEGM